MDNIQPDNVEFTVEKRFGYLAIFVREIRTAPNSDRLVYEPWRKATKSDLPEIMARLDYGA